MNRFTIDDEGAKGWSDFESPTNTFRAKPIMDEVTSVDRGRIHWDPETLVGIRGFMGNLKRLSRADN